MDQVKRKYKAVKALEYYHRNARDPAWREARKAKRKAKHAKEPKVLREQHWRNAGIDLTYDQYLALQLSQNGQCQICRLVQKELHVDHCHSTGRVRGLLCGSCNRGIGLLKDSPSVLRAAAAYLEGYPRA